MRSEMESSYDFSRGFNHFQLRTTQGSTIMSHEDEVVNQVPDISWSHKLTVI